MRNLAPRAPWVATVVVALAIVSAIATGRAGVAGAGQVTPTPRAAASIEAATNGAERDVRARIADAPDAPRPADPSGSLLVRVPRDLVARAEPRATARVVGTVPSGSRFYDVAVTAWVEEVSPDGRWGRVELPYVWPRRHGWIALRGLARRTSNVEVHVDLSDHRIVVSKFGRELFDMPSATGASVSPTPPGEYFVTDRIPFSGGSLGTFAFGISGIQPNLPPGWSGGDQLAIHGTNDPSSVGRSASAGCLRVSERSLDRLKPLLQLGTPVIVVR